MAANNTRIWYPVSAELTRKWGDLGLEPYDFLVYGILRSYEGDHGEAACPSQETLAEVAGLSRGSVQRALRRLRSAGLVEPTRYANRYGSQGYAFPVYASDLFRQTIGCLTTEALDGSQGVPTEALEPQRLTTEALDTEDQTIGCLTTEALEPQCLTTEALDGSQGVPTEALDTGQVDQNTEKDTEQNFQRLCGDALDRASLAGRQALEELAAAAHQGGQRVCALPAWSRPQEETEAIILDAVSAAVRSSGGGASSGPLTGSELLEAIADFCEKAKAPTPHVLRSFVEVGQRQFGSRMAKAAAAASSPRPAGGDSVVTVDTEGLMARYRDRMRAKREKEGQAE